MNSIQSIALSGLQVAQTRMSVAAHDIANAATPEFHRQVVAAATSSGGGVSARVDFTSATGSDLAADLIAQRQALIDYRANIQALRVGDSLLGTVLDTFA